MCTINGTTFRAPPGILEWHLHKTQLIFKTGNFNVSSVVVSESIQVQKQRLRCSNNSMVINGSCGAHRVSGSQFEWKWGGHVTRMDQGRWAQATSVWGVRIGKRRTWRPKTRWADTFKRATGLLWRNSPKRARMENTHNIRKNDISMNSSTSYKNSAALPGYTRRPLPSWD